MATTAKATVKGSLFYFYLKLDKSIKLYRLYSYKVYE